MRIDNFKILLTFRLSGLRTRRIFTPYGEVIIGRKGRDTFSATICFKSLELAAKRLKYKLQKQNFIIYEKVSEPSEIVEIPKITLCTPEQFIEYFKSRFKFAVSVQEILEYDITERFMDSFEDKREALAILNSMYLLYLYREFPEVFIHTKDSRMRMELEPDIPMLEEVKNMGYAFSHPKTKHPKVRMNYLNDDGREIARNVFVHRLKNSERQLKNLIEKTGRRKVFLIALGTLKKGEMSLDIREPVYLPLRDESVQTIIPKLYLSDETLFKELRDVQSPLQLISRFLTTFVIYDDAISFFRELEKIGLAIKVRIFSKWGVEVGEIYRAPPELAEYLMDVCYFDISDDLVKEFMNNFSNLFLQSVGGVAGERMLNELFMGIDMELVEFTEKNSNIRLAELIAEVLGV